MWYLTRAFPIMFGTFTSETDPAWLIYLQFLHISERFCPPKFNHGDHVYLQSLIDEFFQFFFFFFEICNEYNFKSKGHFLQHYLKMIQIFGLFVKT